MLPANHISYQLIDEAATVALGRQLAIAVAHVLDGAASKAQRPQSLCIYLLGDLGAGKTTLSRGIIQALGHKGAVKSPTYTLVEPYEIPSANGKLRPVYHFDLYRLADPAELEFLGLDDYFSESSLCLIEWPVRGGDFIPTADIVLTLSDMAIIEKATPGRQLHCASLSPAGDQVLLSLQANQDSAALLTGTADSLNNKGLH